MAISAEAGDYADTRLPIDVFRHIVGETTLFSSVLAWQGDYPVLNLEANGVRDASTAAKVDGDYFATLGIRPYLGRFFSASERDPVAVVEYHAPDPLSSDPSACASSPDANSPGSMTSMRHMLAQSVSDTLAARLFPAASTIGRQLTIDGRSTTVVSIVAEARLWNPRRRRPMAAYFPVLQNPDANGFWIDIRAAHDPAALAASVRPDRRFPGPAIPRCASTH